jgi:hypothetical protein
MGDRYPDVVANCLAHFSHKNLKDWDIVEGSPEEAMHPRDPSMNHIIDRKSPHRIEPS